MKRLVSLLLIITLMLSVVPYALAEDSFSVSHTAIKCNDEIKTINLVLPVFEGFKGAEEVNKKVLDLALDAIGEANAMAKDLLPLKKELMEKGELAASLAVTLDMTYDYIRLGDVLSVQLNIDTYSGGAHGLSQVLTITVNTLTGEIYEFKDLFKENVDYNSVIKDSIVGEIAVNPEIYFSDYQDTINSKNGNYEFYLDGDKLVVYFGLYDIAPYAAGIRYFAINSADIKDILKAEVYNSIKNGKERGFISYNGKDISSTKVINNNDTILVPLRIVAEALGYKVDWNKKDGVVVAGKPVSNELQKIIDGTTYVHLSYFRDVLAENVSLGAIGNDKIIVRAYGKDSAGITNSSLMEEYVSPITAKDAVNMYAEAVKMRNGMVQYALLDDSLRGEKYDEYKGSNFVTGTSSPWVDSYEIIQLDENLYQIRFNYRTSVPTDRLVVETNVRLIEDGQYIKIAVIE